MFRCHIKASEQPQPYIRISIVLQANETQDLSLWGNLVLKHDKYVSGILRGQSLHRYANITALDCIKHGGGQIYIKTDAVTTEKNWRYKQQLSYRKSEGLPQRSACEFLGCELYNLVRG